VHPSPRCTARPEESLAERGHTANDRRDPFGVAAVADRFGDRRPFERRIARSVPLPIVTVWPNRR
jgi:hypothetical protein